jgi:hypothetical protein
LPQGKNAITGAKDARGGKAASSKPDLISDGRGQYRMRCGRGRNAGDAGRFSRAILVNGSILAMDASDRVAEALAIAEDKIVAVGSSADIRSLAGPETCVERAAEAEEHII